MSPVLNRFLQCMADLGGDTESWTYAVTDRPRLTLPAKHDAVGPLTVSDDGDELTIEIGRKHHAHFSAIDYSGDTQEAKLMLAARDAAQFVFDVVADRVLVTNDFLGDQCIGSSQNYLSQNADGLPQSLNVQLTSGNIRHEHFVWSGPLDDV